jgi:hypothetical protein
VDGAAGLNSTYISATRTIFQGKSWKNGVAGLNYSYKVCLLYTQKTYIISYALGGYVLGFYTFIALILQKLLFQPFLPISLLTVCSPPANQLSFLTPRAGHNFRCPLIRWSTEQRLFYILKMSIYRKNAYF